MKIYIHLYIRLDLKIDDLSYDSLLSAAVGWAELRGGCCNVKFTRCPTTLNRASHLEKKHHGELGGSLPFKISTYCCSTKQGWISSFLLVSHLQITLSYAALPWKLSQRRSTILLKIFRYVWIGGYYLVKKQYNVVISLANVLLETTKQNTIFLAIFVKCKFYSWRDLVEACFM